MLLHWPGDTQSDTAFGEVAAGSLFVHQTDGMPVRMTG